MNGRDASGGDGDEEEAWRDLVARFDGQADGDQGIAPWPERENLRTSLNREQAADQAEPGPGRGAAGPAAHQPTGPPDGPAAGGITGPAFHPDAGPADDDHFVPPPPPPLPRLEPVIKGAWLALFGGPAYLLVATAAGWAVPGWAAFCAMAAFVAGFVVLVLHLGNDRPGDGSGSGSDDGAVV